MLVQLVQGWHCIVSPFVCPCSQSHHCSQTDDKVYTEKEYQEALAAAREEAKNEAKWLLEELQAQKEEELKKGRFHWLWG